MNDLPWLAILYIGAYVITSGFAIFLISRSRLGSTTRLIAVFGVIALPFIGPAGYTLGHILDFGKSRHEEEAE